MEEKIKKQSITRLCVSDNILNTLRDNNIKNLETLCNKSKKDLENMGLLPSEYHKVEIELQLMGLNLRNSL